MELREVLDRYYAPDYTHRSDGRTLNRDEFTKMIARIRRQVTKRSVTVLDGKKLTTFAPYRILL